MRSDCPLNFGLEIFGDKWTLLIIRDLIFFGKRYYNGFLASAEGISTNILANRLAMPEQENFIKKNKDEMHKQKLIYSLTEKGIDLLPIILEIGLWSDKYAGSLLNDQKDVVQAEAKKDRVKGVSAMKKRLYQTHVKS